ncbi:MAG TPA: tetratricopeptide repeat protein [Nitrosospira sp.]|nr:tetratricopeptide repeat protein [Nitrosospira sp.]
MEKISRNAPCPCGSGKKYKHCCQKNEQSLTASPQAANSPTPSISQYLQAGMEHHQAGHLPQAEAIYQRILQIDPNHPGALHFLGLIAKQVGNAKAAIALIGKSLAFKPDYAEAHNNLGNVLKQQGRLEEAVTSYRKALKLKPDFAEAYGNLGNALKEQADHGERGRLDEAAACYRKALALKPDLAEMHSNLGNALRDQGKGPEAIANYRKAITLIPEFAEAHNNLGNVLNEQGKLEEALSSFEKALTFRPDFTEAHNNLGNVLRELGRAEDAIASYRRALSLNPDYVRAYCNLGNVLREQGKVDEAIISYQRALQISESAEIRTGFAQCIRNLYFTYEILGIRPLVARALCEPWVRPAEIANPAVSLIKLDPAIKPYIDWAQEACPTGLPGQDLFGNGGLGAIYKDTLLRCLLENTPVCDLELERLLTLTRSVMLHAAMCIGGPSHAVVGSATVSDDGIEAPGDEALIFFCALARQCFINEYIFSCSTEELDQAQTLKDRLIAALASGQPIPSVWLPAVATYFPLISLAAGEAHLDALLDRSWPDAVSALLVQQVHEPLEERRNRLLIPSLTSIVDDTSLIVQKQYEENPYPRWVKLPRCGSGVTIDTYLHSQFPLSGFKPMGAGNGNNSIDILIAGCGTGQHAITTAQRYQNAKVLGIDLSLTSLCYAKRKTRSLGLGNINYAQADIMSLDSGGSVHMFDLIEAVGVLHHLRNPLAGWRKLLALLRPGGFMRLGLYSARARRNETEARQFIAEHGYKANPEGIRRCREVLATGENAVRFRHVLSARDFYTMSECRDLLFHVQEHCFTLLQLKDNLHELDLAFIGFLLDTEVIKRYAKQFPHDAPQTDLDNWHAFEAANPETFTGMYQFWVQKRG